MPIVTTTRTFNAPRTKVWEILADHGNVADFHPGIESSRRLDDKVGLGGTRACEFGKGQGVDEEVVEWDAGKTLAFKGIAFRKMPMQHLVGTFHLSGDKTTTVRFDLDYRMKGGFLMDLMARGMMKKAGKGMFDGLEKKV